MKPPSTPIALESVPTWMSTRPCRPKWSTVPAPPVPSTPDACASSTIMMAPWRSATSTRSGSGAMSPSIENTPSVMSNWRRPGAAVSVSSRVGGARVPVLEDLDLRARQPRAVDDRRMVETVRDDDVFLREDGGHGPGVGGEARLEHQRGLGVFERREPALQLQVCLHRPRDRANRAGTGAQPLRCLSRRAVQARMARQPQVVVRSEVDDVAAVEAGAGAGHPLQRARVLQQAVGIERRQFVHEVVEGSGHLPNPTAPSSA